MKPVTTIPGETGSTPTIGTLVERAFSRMRVKYSLHQWKHWNKVGYHIGLLIMAALRYLCPEFLEEGRLCWLRSPLYIVKTGKTEKYFFTDEEFETLGANVRGEVTRAKGLGALSAEQAKNSMFSETYQRLDVLVPDVESIMLLEDLMGSSVTPRKEFIFNNVDFSEVRE